MHLNGRRFDCGSVDGFMKASRHEYEKRINSKMVKIFPVLLAGGAGTRLWPLSHKSYPKQFSSVMVKRHYSKEVPKG